MSNKVKPLEIERSQGANDATNAQILTTEENQDSSRPLQKQGAEDDEKVESFGKSIEYWLSCIGYAVGFGNIWRFPYLVFKNGGAAFLIPYLLALVCIAQPMYMMETAFGQLIRCKLHERYAIINKGLWGFGLCQALVNSLTVIYYITLMAWSIAFLIKSFKNPLPWTENVPDDEIWDRKFFHDQVLERTPDISWTGEIVPMMVLCMFLSYFIVYFCSWKGLESTGVIVYVTAPLPYLLMTILLIKGLTLEGAGQGLKFLFVPDWSKLGNITIWQDAVVQIMYSSGVSFGPLLYYGTARAPNDKIVGVSYYIPLINSATSIYAALTIFSFLGHVSQKTGIPIEDISDGGLDLAFIAYPGLLSMLKGSNFWSIVFFIMLTTVGVDSVFGMFDFTIQYFEDFFPAIRRNMKKEVYVLLLSIAFFLFGLIFCLESGFWIFDLFNTYSCGLTLVFLCVSEIFMIVWMFGIDNLDDLMFFRTEERFPKLFKIMIKYVTPTIISIILVVGIVNEFFLNKSEMPKWALWMGRLLMLIPTVCSLIGFCYKLPVKNVEELIQKQYQGNIVLKPVMFRGNEVQVLQNTSANQVV